MDSHFLFQESLRKVRKKSVLLLRFAEAPRAACLVSGVFLIIPTPVHQLEDALNKRARGIGLFDFMLIQGLTFAGSSDQTRKRGAGARGNIHGLNRSSEEEADPRRNNFWNGNSTQFGSDDKDQ